MGQQVKADISMSLDGFITGPNDGIEKGLGEGGERLHEWLYGLASWRERHGYEGGTTDRDAEVLEEASSTRSRFTSCPSCSATACGCSIIPRTSSSSWRPRG